MKGFPQIIDMTPMTESNKFTEKGWWGHCVQNTFKNDFEEKTEAVSFINNCETCTIICRKRQLLNEKIQQLKYNKKKKFSSNGENIC